MRVWLVAGLAAVALGVVLFLPPIPQDPRYHDFADQRTLWGVPNFWNVASNLPFLLVAAWGLLAFRSPTAFLQNWERIAYVILLAGVALVAFGSSYYHYRPDNGTLFWDRLPMTIVFMSLLATTIGERISPHAGRLLLVPLLAVGVASILHWKFSGDLRFYGVVQFYPMVALPLMLILFPARYSGTAGVYAMIGFYLLAKALEFFDHQVAGILPTGGHPWKHLAGAVAMMFYLGAIRSHRPVNGCPRQI